MSYQDNSTPDEGNREQEDPKPSIAEIRRAWEQEKQDLHEEAISKARASNEQRSKNQGHLGSPSVGNTATKGAPKPPKKVKKTPKQTNKGRSGSPSAGKAGTRGNKELSDLLDELVSFLKHYVYFKDESVYDLLALWIIHTYGMEKWRRTGRLFINAPQRNSGKTTLGEILSHLSNNGFLLGSQSVSYVFRKIDEASPNITLFVDEADNIWKKGASDTSELQKIINNGYACNAWVGRSEGTSKNGEWKPREYKSFAPMAIIGLSQTRLPGTLLSRCFNIRMTFIPPSVDLEPFDEFDHEDYFPALRERLTNAVQHLPNRSKPDRPDHLRTRDWEIWTPLYVIAEIAGPEWMTRVDIASRTVVKDTNRELSIHERILRLSFLCFKENNRPRYTPRELAEYINKEDEIYGDVTAQAVSHWLGQYEIRSYKSNGNREFRREDVYEKTKIWQPEFYREQMGPAPRITCESRPLVTLFDEDSEGASFDPHNLELD